METLRDCAFCRRDEMDIVLAETPHFLVLADYAPLVEGHLLIIPREHLACYGALPEAWEAEFVALKARVAAFLRVAYAEPSFFEHGVFRQTVFHAHLHAFPFGPLRLPRSFPQDATAAPTLADVRAWYNERGHYLYIEPALPTAEMAGEMASGDGRAARAEASGNGLLFPPSDSVHMSTLFALRQASSTVGAWAPAPLRRVTGREKMARVAAAWESFAHDSSPASASAEHEHR